MTIQEFIRELESIEKDIIEDDNLEFGVISIDITIWGKRGKGAMMIGRKDANIEVDKEVGYEPERR